MTRRVRVAVLVVVATLGVLVSLGAPRADGTVRASSTTPAYTSLSDLQKAIKQSLGTRLLPASLNPSLSAVAASPYRYEGASYQHSNCDPYAYPSQASHPNPCWYGATKASDPVIAIFGDSFVGNWIPALNVVGQNLGYRIAEFQFAGCPAPDVAVSANAQFPPAEAAACNEWHSTLPPVVAALHAAAIVVANGELDWGYTGDKQWISGLKSILSKMNPKKSSVQILIGTGPHLTTPAPNCLAAYPTSISKCVFHYTTASNFQLALNRDASAVKLVGVHLIPTVQWACIYDACPLVVGTTMVDVDYDHLSIAYSETLEVLLQAAMKPLL